MELSGLVSRATSGLDEREVKEVLEGHLTTDLAKPVSKYIRIFLSSDLTDSVLEREFLRERVFSHLRRFSQSLGLQFHIVDVYHSLPASWLCQETGADNEEEKEERGDDIEGEEVVGGSSRLSVEESSGNSGGIAIMCELELQGVLQLALKEIQVCQNMSAGPTFVTLQAQKYGHKPLPVHIPDEEFTLLCDTMLDSADERQLVQQWYQLDSNALPPQYTLLQHFDENWVNTQKVLSATLRKAAKLALGKDPSKVQKYIMSASEAEVTAGLFQLKADPNHCCLWSKRTFTDLLEQRANDPALSQFCDLVTGQRGLEFDSEALKSLNHLKEARMPAKYIGLDSSNIFEFSIKWQRGKGLDLTSCPPHEDYLIQMCERVCHTLQEHISHAADIVHMQTCNATYQEVLVHSTHCQRIAQTYMDRPDISEQIQSYLDGPSDHPLVVYGPTGYGKTAVMASAAHRLRERNPVSSMAIIVRFLGLTPHSSSIFHTLRSMSKQIMAVYDIENAVIPGDYQGVAAHFTSSLHRASADKPLYLFLDAVDQLSPEDGASGMSWLPLDLPPHVKLVLSTSSEVEYRCFPVLQSLMAKHAGSLVQVPQMSEVECQQMLSHCLSLEQRTLTPQQKAIAMTALQQCPVPLFLQLILRQLRSWKSYSTLQDPLPTTIDDAVESFYTELEEKYGKTLISHLLAYVTASKHGLTEPEILDILALDTEVITEVNVKYGSDGCTALTCLPPAIWAQLSLHIQPLLTYQAGVDHSLVLRWRHRRLREMAETRYLTHSTEQVYGMLAEYFGSTGSETKGAASHDEENGSVSSLQVDNQPLLLNTDPAKFNIRKLTELPYALAKSGQNAYQTLIELLLDYQWLKACALSLPCRDILHDFTPVIPPVPIGRSSTDVDHELRLLRQALMYSTTVLNVNSSQFCVQLAGRLLPYITNYPEKYPILRNLVMIALEDMGPLLTPLQPLSHIPGGPHLVSMEGHRDIVSCMSTVLVEGEQRTSLILVTSSWDKTLKSWDLATTGVLKTFDGHSDRVLSVALSVDGVYAASGSDDKSVRYWYVPTAECIHVMKGHSAAVNAVAVTDDASKTVSASSDGTVKVWNTDQNSSSCGQLIYTLRSHKKPVLTAVLRGNVLASGTSSGCIFFTDIVSGEQLKMVQGHNVAVTALAAETVDGCCYLVSGAADQSVKIWDFITCNLLHSLPTGMDSSAGISSLSIGSNGRLIVSNGQREPGIWDLKSGTHLYNLPPHTTGVESTAMTDSGRLAITGSSGPSLQIWDVLSPPVSHTTRLHREDITNVAISGCGGLGVCASQSGSICVFDTDTMSTIQQLQPHSAVVNHVLSYKDINKLLSASADGTICLWDGETGEVLQRFEAQESAINCLAITMNKDLLMTGSQNGEVAFWSIDTGKKLKTFSDHISSVITVAFIKQKKDQFMLSSSKDGNLCIREFQTAKVVVATQLHTGELNSTSIAPNAMFMVCGSTEGLSYIISLPYGTVAAVLTGHSAGVNTVKVTPDSTKCVTGSDDSTIRVWSIKNSECMAVLYVDAPVLACDVNYNMTILYGTEGGWVSTAAFQVDPSKPNALISRLKARDSPANKSSSTTASPSPLDSGIKVPQIKGNEGSNDITDQGEEPTSNTCDRKIIPLPTEPDDATNGSDDRETELHGCMENGKLTHGPSTDTIETSKSTTAGAESMLPTSDESTMKNKANSSACILL